MKGKTTTKTTQVNVNIPARAYSRAAEMKANGIVKYRDAALVQMLEAAMELSSQGVGVHYGLHFGDFAPSDNVRPRQTVKLPTDLHHRVMELSGKSGSYDRSGVTLKVTYEYLLTKGAELV